MAKKIKKKREGRPLKFKNAKQLQKKIDEYFDKCDSNTIEMFYKGVKYTVKSPLPYTIGDLAYHLDTSRETLLDYEDEIPKSLSKKEKHKFSDTIKKAKDRIHAFTERQLFTPKIATGVIFNLTNNWGWNNKYDVTSGGKPIRGTVTTFKIPQNGREQ